MKKRGLEEKKRNQKVEKKSWSWWRETCDGSSAPWLNMWLCLTVSCRQILIQCQPYITKWKKKKRNTAKSKQKPRRLWCDAASLLRSCFFSFRKCVIVSSDNIVCILYLKTSFTKPGALWPLFQNQQYLKKKEEKSPSSFKIDRKKHLHELAELDIRLSKRLLWMLRLTPALLTRLGLVLKKLETPNWRPRWDLCSSKWRPTPWHHLVS